ncbi:MAG TPA: autotransporter domain-containing protein, partial [Rhabdochlamydiaceae bacterium]
INGGSLLLGAADQISNTSTVTILSSTWDLQSNAETISELIFNGGTLTQGGAVLSLASAGTALSMRDTNIAGPIALTNGGAIRFDAFNNGTATISGTIDLGTNVTIFDIDDGTASSDMIISGIISNGGLNKTGLGTLVLTGANTYSGGTLINMGTLQGDTSSLQGNITDDATLVFDQITTGTYSDQINGTGALIKQGSGTVILSNINSVGGITTVSSGSLAVNGSLSGAGTLVVSPGATLQGTGIISKDSSISGVLAPGNNIGIIHFIGAETLTAGSTLEIELNPITADLVDIVGTLVIQPGASLNILPEMGSYPSTFLYTIVQTTGGVTGTFSSVTSPLPTFAGSVVYTPLDVLLELSIIPFNSIISGGNAGAVAKCLDRLAATPCSNQLDVISSLRTIPTEKALKEALLQMQPSAFTSLAVIQENDLSYLRNTLYNRMETHLYSCCCDNSPKNDVENNQINTDVENNQINTGVENNQINTDVENNQINTKKNRNLTLWLTALGAHTKQNNHREEPGFSANSPGIFLGLDSNFGKKSLLGGGMGYTQTHMHWSHKRGKADIQGGYGTIYGRWASSHAYMQGSLIGGYSFYSTYRNIEFGTGITAIKETAKGHHNGIEGSGHLKAGFNYGCRYVTFSPFIGCDYFYVHENFFHEHGAESLNLKVKAKNADLLSSEAGVDLSHCFGRATKSFTPFLKLSVIRESRFKGQKEKASFECGCDFSVSGLYPSRTLAGVALGFSASALTKTLSLFYQGKFSNSYRDNSGYLQYSFRF